MIPGSPFKISVYKNNVFVILNIINSFFKVKYVFFFY